MALLGRTLLLLGLAISLYGIGASIYGARARRRDWVASGRRAVYALAGVMLTAFVLVEIAFQRNDFAFNIVAQTSSTTLSTFYKLTAPWSSQAGSLLLWVMLLSFWSSLVLFATRRRLREIAPYATAVLMGLATFFDALACFAANPFNTTAPAPTQGAGLDPLLQHPTMMFHPPMLYSGYTLMAIPFSFAIGALITGRVGSEWIRDTRRFALAAWLFLGVGITLGALWSYTELGWGGYWGWDAVENAALMPWLCITAFIHSIQIQEKRGMLKVWNVSLILLSGTLAVFGTFLVRSGVLDSIHAFGASTLGVPFVILLAVMILGSIGLVLFRRPALRSEHRIDSLLSREAMFLLQNLVLVAMVFVIFWVTMFPLISQAITGTKVSVGPPAFTPFVVPLALVLVALAGIGPLISWRRATVANLRRNFRFPVGVAAVVLIAVLALAHATSKPLAIAMWTLGAFVIGTVLQEFYRGTSARRAITHDAWPVALGALVRRNRRRYGGYMAHLGIAVLLIGVAASSSLQHSRDVVLKAGQSARVDGYRFTYVRPTEAAMASKIQFGAVLRVSKGGRHVTTMHTTRGYYPSTDFSTGVIGRFFAGEADSTVGLDAGVTRNLWAVTSANPQPLTGYINQGNRYFSAYLSSVTSRLSKLPRAQQTQFLDQYYTYRDEAVAGIARRFVTHPWPVEFLIIVAPLVTWVWVGAGIVAFGGLIALWPIPALVRLRSMAVYRARLARELA
ncbi:MAG TPA: cytochrome c-type biogenesis CcmF C-terminal domain-containing protein [Solirubrobacteraceae bacterium]|jgi:cytochrome c-type biogenesis protein CcmF|nr:cytochrome c-type biogenesis CcmF C-terminal domain-containing protein [Solirubrobacteraceae bacterium]